MCKELSHIDEQGKAKMVDVGHKNDMLRIAKASGKIFLQTATIKLIKENQIKKGDVLTIAEIAGIQAAKKCSDLIPLCHQLQINKISITSEIISDALIIRSEVRCIGKTGVEMEALTAVQIALLTVYDMCKSVDNTMIISEIKLEEKTKSEII